MNSYLISKSNDLLVEDEYKKQEEKKRYRDDAASKETFSERREEKIEPSFLSRKITCADGCPDKLVIYYDTSYEERRKIITKINKKNQER